MSFLKQETKIGKSRVGVSVALALTLGSRARIGMCVLCFFDFFMFTHHTSVSVFQPFTRLLSGDVATVTRTPDSSTHTPARRTDALSHNITLPKQWTTTVTAPIITIL